MSSSSSCSSFHNGSAKSKVRQYTQSNNLDDPMYDTKQIKENPCLFQSTALVHKTPYLGGEHETKEDAENSAADIALLGLHVNPGREKNLEEFKEIKKLCLQMLEESKKGKNCDTDEVKEILDALQQDLEAHHFELNNSMELLKQKIR